jgi:hypothetical protein
MSSRDHDTRPHPKRHSSISGQFAARPIEMLESPAYRALSLSAHMVISRIEIELAHHGGNDNGQLPVTVDQFVEYGMHRSSVAPAIREAEALGFIRVERGRGGNADYRRPNKFYLTFSNWRGSKDEPPSHDWKRIKSMDDALRIAREARAAKDRNAVAFGKFALNIRQDIIERTDGIPLFVEEMTKAVLEAGSDSAAEPYSRLTVPASLQASLMARLDRLGAGKEMAQIGAAIGREFSHAVLATVVGKPEAEVNSSLDRLVAAGLLFRQGVAPHETYLFKHALVQDAAYGTLLREPRRALHARIAETLESQFVEIAESQPELLARHYTEAGLTENAALFWGKAGQRSLVRSALVEAIEQLTRALDQFATLPLTPAMRQQEIKLQVALITPLIHVKTAIASETRGAIERARLLIEKAEALGEPPEDPLLLFSVLYGSGLTNVLQFNSEVLRCVSEQFLALAKKHGSTVLLMIGHRLVGTCSLFMGDIADGRKHLDRAFALYDPCEHDALATPFGDAGVSILCSRSSAL